MLVFFMIYFLSFPLKAALRDSLFSCGLSGYLAIEKERARKRVRENEKKIKLKSIS